MPQAVGMPGNTQLSVLLQSAWPRHAVAGFVEPGHALPPLPPSSKQIESPQHQLLSAWHTHSTLGAAEPGGGSMVQVLPAGAQLPVHCPPPPEPPLPPLPPVPVPPELPSELHADATASMSATTLVPNSVRQHLMRISLPDACPSHTRIDINQGCDSAP